MNFDRMREKPLNTRLGNATGGVADTRRLEVANEPLSGKEVPSMVGVLPKKPCLSGSLPNVACFAGLGESTGCASLYA